MLAFMFHSHSTHLIALSILHWKLHHFLHKLTFGQPLDQTQLIIFYPTKLVYMRSIMFHYQILVSFGFFMTLGLGQFLGPFLGQTNNRQPFGPRNQVCDQVQNLAIPTFGPPYGSALNVFHFLPFFTSIDPITF